MASFEDQTRRLERAKRQYELMLLHYSDDFMDEQLSPTTSVNHASTTPITPMSERFQHKVSSSETTLSNPAQSVSISDKDLIVALQDEVERLRHKLDNVIDTVEHVVQEAQVAQNDICSEFERQLHSLSTKNASLESENEQLRATLNLSQAELAVEREQLLKALQFIERQKCRGRENGILRRKSNGLLLTTSALAYSSSSAKSKPSAI